LLPHLDVLESAEVLKGLTAKQMTELGSVSSVRRYAPGEFILREGDLDPILYVLVDGHAHLTKNTSFSGDTVRMTEFREGDVLGELKIIDPRPNSASVVSVTKVTAVAIDLEALAKSSGLAEARGTILSNVGKILAARLRATTGQGADALQRELEESRARTYAGRFIVLILAMLATYQLGLLALELVPLNERPASSILSFAMIVWAAIPITLSLKHTPFPLESYGLTARRGGQFAVQALLWTIPILALMLFLKLALMRWAPSMIGRPLFDPGAVFIRTGSFNIQLYFVYALIYSVHAPLQEFVVRAGFQGTLQHLSPAASGGINWKAILVSNLLFSAAHSYFGLWFCFAVFVPGLFWGWMFARQRSLIGVAISHVLIGLWGIFALGLTATISTH
jgi:CRP-like cAMP-binding protein/membrane protease YdiL (CAAX protease family)